MRSLFLAAAMVFGPAVNASVIREDIGELRIHDLLLRPSFTYRERKEGAFSIGDSSFALRWDLEEKFDGVIRIGPRTLLNPIARYQSVVPDDVTLVEAYAEYVDNIGRFRLGRVPVEFGYEGRLWERNLIFPRSYLFEKRAMMLRDVGFSYEIANNKWFTGLVVHNGESDKDLDGQIWYTARWGFREEGFEVGLAGQTGDTKPAATAVSGDTLAGIDPSRDAHWLIGGLYMAWNQPRWEYAFEFYMGENVQDASSKKFHTGHVDVSHEWSKRFSTHLRYDRFEPYTDQPSDVLQRVSGAFVFSNRTKSSNLILVLAKNIEQGTEIPNDEIKLIWSLSPSGVVRF